MIPKKYGDVHEKYCEICKDHHDDDKMLLCEYCEDGYHIFCLVIFLLIIKKILVPST